MNLSSITKAEKEAKEFLVRVKAVKDRAKDDKNCFYGCKETGALKRKSLDLSVSLSDMRKSI